MLNVDEILLKFIEIIIENMSKILGIDLGTKYLGIAVSDDSEKIALPYGVISVKNEGEIFKKIVEIAGLKELNKILLGLPIHLSMDESNMSLLARKIAKRLNKAGFEIILWDERLSSVEAEREMRAMGMKPSHDRKKINEISAVLILQNYLDSQNKQDDDEKN